jgi:hypothetical protein
MTPLIVVVEDDHMQEGPLEDSLQEAFTDAAVETLRTERQFRERLPGLVEHPPKAVVMDVMLRWDSPRRDSPLPPLDVAEGGYYRAGLRCAHLMAQEPALRGVPVLLYTILERSDLERDGQSLGVNVTYLRKSSDLGVLIRKIRELVRPT